MVGRKGKPGAMHPPHAQHSFSPLTSIKLRRAHICSNQTNQADLTQPTNPDHQAKKEDKPTTLLPFQSFSSPIECKAEAGSNMSH